MFETYLHVSEFSINECNFSESLLRCKIFVLQTSSTQHLFSQIYLTNKFSNYLIWNTCMLLVDICDITELVSYPLSIWIISLWVLDKLALSTQALRVPVHYLFRYLISSSELRKIIFLTYWHCCSFMYDICIEEDRAGRLESAQN